MKKRNFRKKGGQVPDSPGAAPERPSGDGNEAPGRAARGPVREKKGVKGNLLSFDADEDVVTVPKKRAESRQARRQYGAAAVPPQPPPVAVAAAGAYTAERLEELKKSTPRMPSSLKKKEQLSTPGGSTALKISGSFKPVGARKDDRFELTATALVTDDPPEAKRSLPRPPGSPPGRRSDARGSEGKGKQEEVVQQRANVDSDLFMPPDAETIRLAKAKRERLRQSHLPPDYIPLGGASNLLSQDFKNKDGAEGSESEEDQEENLRLKFMTSTAKMSQQHGDRADMPAAGAAGSDAEDEDAFIWAQIRKGVGGAGAGTSGGTKETNSAAGHKLMTSQAQGVLKALRDDLVRLQDAQHQAERNLGRTSDTVQSTLQEVDSLKSELAAVGVKYADMQELKAYVADLCDCLKSKAAYVEELEDHMKSLMEERANSAAEMRESTNEEDYKIADASVSSALDVLSRGGSHAAAAKAAEDAASAVEEKLQGVGSTPELDEFGRNINLMHQAAAKDRAEARKARWEKERQKAKDLDFSSEDVNSASESEAKRFDSRCEEVLQAAASVFADAAPEFGSLPSVCRRLGEWKARYPKAYRDAYLSTSLPALIAPFARLDLLRWHPIFGHDVGFDSQQWYTELDMYGQSQPVNPVDSTEQAAGLVAEDPDGDLVPQLVSKLVLPLASHMLTKCWCPEDLQQTRMAVEMLHELLVYVPADNPELQALVTSVRDKFGKAVDNCAVPVWPAAAIAASQPAKAVVHARFCRSVHLAAGLCSFCDILPSKFLQSMVLETLIGRRLVAHLRGGFSNVAATTAKLAILVDMMPSDWFGSGIPKEAAGLHELLSSFARHLEGQRVEALRHNKGEVTASALRLASMLSKVGDDQLSKRLARMFGGDR